MPIDDSAIVIAPLIQLGATYITRNLPTGESVVWGVQCREKPITDEHVELIAQCTELRAVGLEGTKVTNHCLPILARLRHLESLDLDRTAIDDNGLDLLREAKQIEFLHIEDTRVTERGVLALQQYLPNCEVVSQWT